MAYKDLPKTKIRKWNEIDDYNKALSLINNQKKEGLKMIFDSYIYEFYMDVYCVKRSCEVTKNVLTRFFLDIWENTDNYLLSDGNIDVKLFLKKRLKNFM